jgi:hypothetical protein
LKQLLVGSVAGVLCLAATMPWQKKSPEQWTPEDVQRVTSNSPWAQTASATFPDPRRNEEPESVYTLPGAAQAGMAGSRGVTDGRWDGGVARNTGGGLLPTLPVLVRWDSALPVRQALGRAQGLGGGKPPFETERTLQEPKNYIITVEGLVPAGRYSRTGQLETKSSSDESTGSVTNPERVLEGLMAHSKLLVRGRAPIACENAAIDSHTGAVHLFFPRSVEIRRSDKEVAFSTRFGSLTVEKRFRLSDMTYRGKLEL